MEDMTLSQGQTHAPSRFVGLAIRLPYEQKAQAGSASESRAIGLRVSRITVAGRHHPPPESVQNHPWQLHGFGEEILLGIAWPKDQG